MRTTANANITSLQSSDITIQTKKSEIKNYETQLAVLKQTLADMKAGPDSNDKTLQLNSLKQSQLSLQQTSQQKDNYEIRAPFDGTVDAIGFKVGDTVSSNA
jgi:multidrug resistance efflux pump